MKKNTKPPSVESIVEKQIREYLALRGLMVEKIHSGKIIAMRGTSRVFLNLAERGTPDLLTCVRGRMVWIEVKKSPEEVVEWERQWDQHVATKQVKGSWERSIYQHTVQDKWRRMGGAEIIVCSSVEEFAKDLTQILCEMDAQDAMEKWGLKARETLQELLAHAILSHDKHLESKADSILSAFPA